MKKRLLPLLLFVACLPMLSFSQTETTPAAKVPAWVCEKGWWVVENNVQSPRNHTVRFYDLAGHLVYTETLNDVKLKLKRKKTLLRLKSVLDQAVTTWEAQAHVPVQKDLLAVALKQ